MHVSQCMSITRRHCWTDHDHWSHSAVAEIEAQALFDAQVEWCDASASVYDDAEGDDNVQLFGILLRLLAVYEVHTVWSRLRHGWDWQTMDVGRHTANITSVIYVCCVDAKSLAVTVNGSVDDASTAVVNNDVEADDDRWEQVQSRSRTVFNAAVSWHMLLICLSTQANTPLRQIILTLTTH